MNSRISRPGLDHRISAGRLGGHAAAAALTPEERSVRARKAARARWSSATSADRRAQAAVLARVRLAVRPADRSAYARTAALARHRATAEHLAEQNAQLLGK